MTPPLGAGRGLSPFFSLSWGALGGLSEQITTAISVFPMSNPLFPPAWGPGLVEAPSESPALLDCGGLPPPPR